MIIQIKKCLVLKTEFTVKFVKKSYIARGLSKHLKSHCHNMNFTKYYLNKIKSSEKIHYKKR